MKLSLPFGGLDERDAFTEQRLGFSPDLLNIVPWDSITGRWRLSQRAGWSKFCATIIGASKVRDIQSVTSANDRLTYTSAGNSVVTEQNAATPAVSDSKNVRVDRQGNTYWLSGRTSVVKRNSAGVQIWIANLPTSDTGHEIRALFVDVDDRVYAAVSTGGLQSTAKMVSWRQTNDNKTELVWDVTLGAYVESIKVKDGKLVTVQNMPDRGKAEVVLYTAFTVADPTEVARWKTSYPANDMDVGIDGSVFVAAEPLSNRGFDPSAPDASQGAVDWTPELLTNFNQRKWAWYKNDDDEQFEITPVSLVADSLDGGTVEAWYDSSGNGRHLFAGSTTGTAGPKFRSLGSSGGRSVYFNGSTSKLVSGVNQGVTDAFEQLTSVPGYTGSMFSLHACFKATNKTALQWLFGIKPTASFANGIQAFLNREASSTLAGTNTAGAMSWFENPASGGQGTSNYPNHYPITSLHPWQPTTTGAARNLKNDWLIVTLIRTNGVSGFKSYLRINGNPVDEWTSTAATWTDAFQIGSFTNPSTSTTLDPSMDASPFQGEMFEMLVLREYTPAGGSLSLISQPSYPESNWGASSNTEVEKIESYMAGKHGCLHVLPIGTTARLVINSAPTAADTVTIGGTTYTFRAALGGGGTIANEVLINGIAGSALNLIRAVNLSGTPGTDYGSATAVNGSAWAFPFQMPETTGDPQVILRSVSRTTTTFATTETLTDAASIFTNTTSVDTLAATGAAGSRENDGFFPHPYGIQKTTRATGGPPRQSDADYALPSKAALLNSVYGLVVKHSDGGRVRWVATSDYDGSATSVGGVGYGVVISSVGDVYSMGPRQAATGAILADDVDIRKIVDQGDTFQGTLGTTALTNWIDDPGALTYHYPRMAVDKYDQLWAPIYSAGQESLIGYAKLGTTLVGNDNANELAIVTNITDDPNAYAVAIDPNYPEYPPSFTNTRPRYVYLATEKTGANNYALYKLGLVTVTSQTSGSAVTRTLLAVCGADLKTFTSGGTVTTVGASVFDANAMFITSAVFDGRVFYSDGGQKPPIYFDTRAPTTTSTWTPTDGGEILTGIKYMVVLGERMFIATATKWACCEVSDAFKWNVFPFVPTYSSAADGPTSTAGRPHDAIQTLIPTATDRLIFGCANSIRMLVGNPAVPNSQLVVITPTLGMAFGPCWALDGEGTIYFVSSDCGVYAMPETGGQPVPISHPSSVNAEQASILRRLQAINLTTHYTRLTWDKRNQCLYVCVEPYGAGGSIVEHYLWHKPTNSWWPWKMGATSPQPTAGRMLDGDTDSLRRFLIGTEGGYVLTTNEAAKTDDGSPVEVRCLIFPIIPDEAETGAKLISMDVLLAANQDGCEFDTFASNVADSTGLPVVSGTLRPGRNKVRPRCAGAHIGIRFRNRSVVSGSNAGSRFSIESAHVEMEQGSVKSP